MSKCLASSDHLREQASQCADAAAPHIDVRDLSHGSGWCGASLPICESSRECIEHELGGGSTGTGRLQVIARTAEAMESAATCEFGHCWDDRRNRIDQDCLESGQMGRTRASELCAALSVDFVRLRVGVGDAWSIVVKDIPCEVFLRFGATLSELDIGWIEVGAVLHGTRSADLCGAGSTAAYCVDLGTTDVVASANEMAAVVWMPALDTLTASVCAPSSACD